MVVRRVKRERVNDRPIVNASILGCQGTVDHEERISQPIANALVHLLLHRIHSGFRSNDAGVGPVHDGST